MNPFANIGTFPLTLSEPPAPISFSAPAEHDPLVSIEEAATVLGIHPHSVRRIVKEGGLKRDKVLGRIRLSSVRNYAK